MCYVINARFSLREPRGYNKTICDTGSFVPQLMQNLGAGTDSSATVGNSISQGHPRSQLATRTSKLRCQKTKHKKLILSVTCMALIDDARKQEEFDNRSRQWRRISHNQCTAYTTADQEYYFFLLLCPALPCSPCLLRALRPC